MAKRFTDTAKWDKAWFRRLSPTMKCVWNFLCDRCDHAGVWEVDLDAIAFFVGAEISVDEIVNALGDRVEMRGGKMLLSGFAEFQYGSLNPDNRVHKSVIDRLEKLTPNKGLIRTLKGLKDKDKEKDKDTEKGECEGGKVLQSDLDLAYLAYPRKEGKSPGMRTAKAQIKTREDLAALTLAIENYKANLKRKGTKPDFVLLWSTFMNQWRDWSDPSHGHADDFSRVNAIDNLQLTDYSSPEGA